MKKMDDTLLSGLFTLLLAVCLAGAIGFALICSSCVSFPGLDKADAQLTALVAEARTLAKEAVDIVSTVMQEGRLFTEQEKLRLVEIKSELQSLLAQGETIFANLRDSLKDRLRGWLGALQTVYEVIKLL